MSEKVITGGCQCGAVRFRMNDRPTDVSICHCRMCQKAFGNYIAPLASVRDDDFTWTRGAPDWFQSSSQVRRGFCGKCGTPLAYDAPTGLAIAAGAFDDPASLPPVIQYGTEGMMPFFAELHRLPGRTTMEDVEAAPFLADLVSYQHPDHDTENWPGERRP